VRKSSVWRRLLGVENVVLEDVRLEADDAVVSVRLYRRQRHLCGWCGRRCSGYDGGEGRRRWRTLDLGPARAFIEAEAPRVRCPEHGVVVARVPWAEHGACSTRAFDDQVAWLAVHSDRTAVSTLMRIHWKTVGWIVARVSRRLRRGIDPLDGLRRIGIDEISFRKGHKYLGVVVDHDRDRLVWAAEGRDERTLDRFFFELGEERRRLITHVSADAGAWIAPLVKIRCPNAVRCMDNFHVLQWATDALDEVRREVWSAARRAGQDQLARDLKRARWALWKGAESLTAKQEVRLRWVEQINQPLYQAYLVKEQLRLIFMLPRDEAIDLLEAWLEWAASSALAPIVKLVASIDQHLVAILNSLVHGLSNARVESLNTRLRLLTHRAFGFHSAGPLIVV
jgi:transposase